MFYITNLIYCKQLLLRDDRYLPKLCLSLFFVLNNGTEALPGSAGNHILCPVDQGQVETLRSMNFVGDVVSSALSGE